MEDQDAGDFPFENRKLRKARGKLSGPSAFSSMEIDGNSSEIE